MKIFQTIKIWMKKNYPSFYGVIRTYAFTPYSNYLNRKSKNFTQRTNVTVSHDGIEFSIVVDPSNGFVDNEIFAAGVYEPDILSVIKQHLRAGDTFVDIGTNIGQHSLFAASVVGPKGKVVSFEPIPRLIEQFNESIILNHFSNIIEVQEFACSNTAESLAIKINPGNIGGSGFHHTNKEYEEIKVETICADNILLGMEKINFIKIDTEGHELEALQGLKETLQKFRPTLLIEFSPAFWGNEAQAKSKEFFALLMENNYSYYDLEAGHTQIAEPLVWSKSFTKIQTNILCVAK